MSWGIVAAGAITFVGGVISSNASKKAAGAQAGAAADANATTLAMYNQNRADSADWRNSGRQALASLNQGLGLPGADSQPLDYDTWLSQQPEPTFEPAPSTKKHHGLFSSLIKGGITSLVDPAMGARNLVRDVKGTTVAGAAGADPKAAYADYVKNFSAPARTETGTPTGDFNRDFTLADFNKDPGYEFRRSEGQNALEATQSARGSLLGGGAEKAGIRYNQDYATGEFSNAYNRFNNDRTTRFNRLSALAGTGQTAVTNIGVLGTNAANNIANNQLDAGNSRASGYVGTANTINSGLQTLGNYYLNRQYGYAPPARAASG